MPEFTNKELVRKARPVVNPRSWAPTGTIASCFRADIRKPAV